MANNTRIYVENLMKFIEKILELISKFSEAAEYSINLQKSTVFLYIRNEQSEIKIKNSFTIASKYKPLRNKSIKRWARSVH